MRISHRPSKSAEGGSVFSDAMVAIIILALLCWFTLRPVSSMARRATTVAESIAAELMRREAVLTTAGHR